MFMVCFTADVNQRGRLSVQGHGLLRNFHVKYVLVKQVSGPGIWLAGSTATSRSEAMLESPC